LLAEIAFGVAWASDATLTGVQTPGGTGALRMAGELVARGNPDATIWLGSPTWANHVPIFAASGLKIAHHPFFNQTSQTLLFDEMISALDAAAPGDAVLLHGCCHNPTGAGFSHDQWRSLASLIGGKGLLPIIDLAYQGLGDGLDEDAFGARHCLDVLPGVLVAYSCDKNFSLYRERTGALWAKGRTNQMTQRLRANMLSLARGNWSMPPDHGAAVVRIILEFPPLRSDWVLELTTMRRRIAGLRAELAAQDDRLAPLKLQSGMFSLLPIASDSVAALRADHGIYVANPGRINIAGLQTEQIDQFVTALLRHLIVS
jgi:aromatic-amino-acid transaminase